MKRKTNLLFQILDLNNMYEAMLNASRNKRNRKEVALFQKSANSEINALIKEVSAQTYKPLPYHSFCVYQPKKREISAPNFRDVVLQHAIYQVLYPIFDKTFCAGSHGLRKNRGGHSAVEYLQIQMRKTSKERYFLQMDICKFYASIQPQILRKLLERKIKERQVVELCMLFVNQNIGIPMGNLLSQLFGLIYLNPLDNFIKRDLKIKKYVRYCDDFALLDLSKEEAFFLKERITHFLNEILALELSKVHCAKVKSGINFVGFRVWQSHKLVRKYTMFKFKRYCKSRRLNSIISALGNACNTQSFQYYLKIAKDYGVFEELPSRFKRRKNGKNH